MHMIRRVMPAGRQAFTLVELLVVIAIIGLLSTVAVVATSNARENSRLAKAQSFEAYLDRALGSGLVAKYDFEEGSGTTARDTSGNSPNNGTLGGGPTWSADTPYAASKYSLNFTGANYIQLASGLGLSTSNFTFSAWVKTASANGQMSFLANAGGGDGYRFGVTNGSIYFLIGTGANTEGGCSPASTANDGKWHHIAASFSRTSLKVSCYVDGRLAGTVALPSAYSGSQDGAPRIGTTVCCSVFTGNLDDVRIYAQDIDGISLGPSIDREKPSGLADADRPRPVVYL